MTPEERIEIACEGLRVCFARRHIDPTWARMARQWVNLIRTIVRLHNLRNL